MKRARLVWFLIAVSVFMSALFVPSTLAADKTLTFWTFLNPTDPAPRSVVQTQLIDKFEKENPGVKVETQVMPWSELGSKLIQAVGAGKGPDVTRVTSDAFQALFAAGPLYPLDDLIAKEPASFKTDWTLPWSQGTYKGKKMVIWIENRVNSFMYRKDLLDSIGASVPKTWDEVGKVAGTLTAKGYVGYAIGLSYGGYGHGLTEWLRPVIWSAGGDLLDKNGKAIFNRAPGRRAFQLLYDMVHKYKAVPTEALAWDVDGLFQGLQAGRVAMEIFGTHRVVTARSAAGIGDNLQVAPVPGLTPNKPAPGATVGWNLGISKDCKDKELAWKFIKFMTSPEAQVLNAKIAGEMPARKSPYQDPWFKDSALGKEMMKWSQYIEANGRFPNYPADYIFLHRVLVEAAQRIVQAKEPIKKVLDEAAKKYDQKIGA